MSDYLTWLASLDEERLVALLRRRPDGLRGSPPKDLATVEARLTQTHSIGAALRDQPRPALEVLTAVLLLGGRASVTLCAWALADHRGGDEHLQSVRHWLGRLEEYGLSWTDGEQIAHAAPLVGAVLAVPAEWGTPARTLIEAFPKDALAPMLQAWGLPRQSTKAATTALLTEAFSDPQRLAGQLERLSPEQREFLTEPDDVALGYTDRGWFTQRVNAYRAAAEAGLGFGMSAYTPYTGEVPAEVRMAVRGRRLPFDPVPPHLLTTDVSANVLDRESRAALGLFNEAGLAVLDLLRVQPVKRLQSGGIGAREITRVAKASRVDSTVVRLVLDLACGAELLEPDVSTLRWGPVTGAWRDLDAGPRVTLLLEQWLRTPRSPTQSHDSTGKSLAAGDVTRDCPLCQDGRLSTLAEWARHAGAVTEGDLAAVVAWKRPLAHTSHRELLEEPDDWNYGYRGRRRAHVPAETPMLVSDDEPDLGTIADEARLLGLVVDGASTPLLRALLGDDRPALVALAGAMLPTAARTASFGSDLTAVVAGPPAGELSALLDSCADRESRGGAVTWRFSTASVRRALDGGTTAAALAARLSDVAVAGLPQPLTYLLADVGRRHGALRLAPAAAVIRCEDEALLAEVAVDRKLRHLALRLVAPTVAVSAAGEADTIAALRAAGYLPMPEVSDTGTRPAEPDERYPDSDDAVVELAFRRPARPDARDRRAAPPSSAQEDEASAAARLVGVAHAPGTSIADPRLVAVIRRVNRTLSQPEVMTLAEAILEGQAVRIRYRSASLAVTERVVSELALSGHLLSAWCHLRNDERDFRVDQILSVAPA